jgi:MFS family permease
LLYGKLYAFYALKWVFISAVALFEIGSLICGAAPNSVALIVGRAIAGVGAAGIFSGAILIIAALVPLQKRPIYTGLIAAMYGIAGVGGPLYVSFSIINKQNNCLTYPSKHRLGGAFTDSKATWRWCFCTSQSLTISL